MLVKNIKYISLVNLCLDKPAITELIQHDFTVNNMTTELKAILPSGTKHQTLMQDYLKLQQDLGGVGASNKAAQAIIKLAEQK